MGDEDPSNSALNASFEVLCEPPASTEPRKCPLDHPSAGQQFETLGGVGTFDDLESPLTERGHGIAQFIASISAIGEDVAQPRIE